MPNFRQTRERTKYSECCRKRRLGRKGKPREAGASRRAAKHHNFSLDFGPLEEPCRNWAGPAQGKLHEPLRHSQLISRNIGKLPTPSKAGGIVAIDEGGEDLVKTLCRRRLRAYVLHWWRQISRLGGSVMRAFACALVVLLMLSACGRPAQRCGAHDARGNLIAALCEVPSQKPSGP